MTQPKKVNPSLLVKSDRHICLFEILVFNLFKDKKHVVKNIAILLMSRAHLLQNILCILGFFWLVSSEI